MTRMTSLAEVQREAIETSITNLGTALKILEIVDLRVKQAKDRSGMKDLLDPAREDIEIIAARIGAAQGNLKLIWKQLQPKTERK